MKRRFLLAAASVAPLLILAAKPAWATDTISSSTSTPVATATATNGAPDNVDVASGGSVTPTASGTAVLLNSSNIVTNEGTISFSGVSNAIGIQVNGGNTGSVTNSGSITVTDGYTPTTDNNTGLSEPPYAQGNNRAGIEVTAGSGVFTGSITNTGVISVHGDNSYGVSILAPITGDYQSLSFTAPSSSATYGTLLSGTITVLGGESALSGTATPPVTGFYVGPSGAAGVATIGGNVTLGAVSATGYQAKAVDIEGGVGGAVAITGTITTTGYETTARTTNTTIAADYTALELQQGGSAVTIGGSVGAGLIISAPPLTASTAASTTASDTVNGQSIVQVVQPAGSIITYGSAPALVVGSATQAITIGVVNGANNTILGPDATSNAAGYGLVNEGSISANGVFDTVNYPKLPGPVSATAIQIGVAPASGSPASAATIAGGIYNTGSIAALAYQADATGIHFLAGGATPVLVNDGVLGASSLQQTTTTTGYTPINVTGILIDAGANLPRIVNNSAITANITGDGGVGGVVGGIIDRSGSVVNVLNTGTISAQTTQTLITTPLPSTNIAIDISAATTAQSITQSLTANTAVTGAAAYNNTVTYSQGDIVNYNGIVYQALTASGTAIDPIDYPSNWREIGTTTPFISGSILFGSGGSSLTVNAGTVNGTVINLGTGSNNAITINGPAGALASATTVTGGIEEVSSSVAANQVTSGAPLIGGGNGTLNISVNNGSLIDTNPHTELVNSVNVGANGLLLIAADPRNANGPTSTTFIAGGASTFANGATIGVTLLSIPTAAQNVYTVLQTTGAGTITAGTFGSGLVTNAPFLFDASAAVVAATGGGASAIDLTVTLKTPAQDGFNNAEAAALNAILAAAPNNAGIQNALLQQFTQAGLKSVYDQLLPSQGQGLFDSLEAAAQSIGSLTSTAPEAASRVAGTSLWLQQVNERVDRDGLQTDGSFSKVFGLVSGIEHSGERGGAVGLSLAYLNANELTDASRIGPGEVASIVEAGAYYRRAVGPLTLAARVGVGYGWFSDTRVFATSTTIGNSTTGTEVQAHSNWGALIYDGHASAAYEQSLGRFYARPELSLDFLELDEGSHSETGGGPGFDLNVASRDSRRLTGEGLIVVGRQWGQATWLRTELRGGYREVIEGQIGDTTASFSGGNPFTLAPDDTKGGWATFGFSIKGGTEFSYLALEGDADFRKGEHRYNLRVAGKSIF
jgi:hypothetical protein